MPFAEVDGCEDPFRFCYVISTPAETSAQHVDPNLPTVVFLHSFGAGKEAFERQFDNPTLRQFNLVAFDLRSYGETGGPIPRKSWRPEDVTEDVRGILEALKLPPCHVFGISLGSYVAVDLAAKYPQKVLSVTACSPLSADEPPHVVDGRLQLSEYFVHFALPKALAGTPDEAYADDIILGAVQLLYNVIHMPVVHAISRVAWENALKNYTGTVIDIDTAFESNVGVFLNRKPFSKDHLSKIMCSVTIIHCADDVAYDYEAANDLRRRLKEAGVDVSLSEVPGPHLGCVTHPEDINSILYDTVISNAPGDTSRFRRKHCDVRLETPFTPHLAKYGYRGSADGDDTEDEL